MLVIDKLGVLFAPIIKELKLFPIDIVGVKLQSIEDRGKSTLDTLGLLNLLDKRFALLDEKVPHFFKTWINLRFLNNLHGWPKVYEGQCCIYAELLRP